MDDLKGIVESYQSKDICERIEWVNEPWIQLFLHFISTFRLISFIESFFFSPYLSLLLFLCIFLCLSHSFHRSCRRGSRVLSVLETELLHKRTLHTILPFWGVRLRSLDLRRCWTHRGPALSGGTRDVATTFSRFLGLQDVHVGAAAERWVLRRETQRGSLRRRHLEPHLQRAAGRRAAALSS